MGLGQNAVAPEPAQGYEDAESLPSRSRGAGSRKVAWLGDEGEPPKTAPGDLEAQASRHGSLQCKDAAAAAEELPLAEHAPKRFFLLGAWLQRTPTEAEPAKAAAEETSPDLAAERGARVHAVLTAEIPLHVRLWRFFNIARNAPGVAGWVVRRGIPVVAAILYTWDVGSDALLARTLFVSGQERLGGLVLVFMFAHYVPTYFMLLRAANTAFFAQRSLLPTAAVAAAKLGVDGGAMGGQAPGSAVGASQQVAVTAAMLEALHLFFYVLLVVLGLPLIPLLDVYMVLSALFLPADTSEAGYVMRMAEDFCRQYERIRLPLECLLESLPQTGLQIYLFWLTRTGGASDTLQVSQEVLIISLLGSMANLTKVSWELYNAYKDSGSTRLEYLWALLSLQGLTKVPIEFERAIKDRVKDHEESLREHDHDHGGATGVPNTAQAAGGDSVLGIEAAHGGSSVALAVSPSSVKDALDDDAPAIGAIAATPPKALLEYLERGRLPLGQVFRLGGPDDPIYQALSPLQRRILMDVMASVNLFSLRALHLQQMEPVVVARLLRKTISLPGHLRIEGNWRLGDHVAGSAATAAGSPGPYHDVIAIELPKAAQEADKLAPVLDLHLARLPIAGYLSADSGSGHREAARACSRGVGKALAGVLIAQPKLRWLLLDRCDVHVVEALKSLEQEMSQLGQSRESAESDVKWKAFKRAASARHAPPLATVAAAASAPPPPNLHGLVVVCVYSRNDTETNDFLTTRSSATPPPSRTWRELHILPGFSGDAGHTADAKVLLAPRPRTRGVMGALVPLLSCVLSPSALSLGGMDAFSKLHSDDLPQASVGMGARGANALASRLLRCAAYTRLTDLAVHDNGPDCGTPSLEWLCLMFQHRHKALKKVAKEPPLHYLEDSPAVPTFNLSAAQQQPYKDVMHGVARRLDLPPVGALDARHLVLAAATALHAPAPITLAAKRSGKRAEGSVAMLVDAARVPGFDDAAGTGTLLLAVVGGLAGLSPPNLHHLNLSSVDLSVDMPAAAASSGAAPQAHRWDSRRESGLPPETAAGHLTGLEHLLRGLKNNTTLKALSLVGCGLTDDDAIAMYEALQRNTALSQLDLSGNAGITDLGVEDGVLVLLAAAASRQQQLTVCIGGGGPSGAHSGCAEAWSLSRATVEKLLELAPKGWVAGNGSGDGTVPHLRVVTGSPEVDALASKLAGAQVQLFGSGQGATAAADKDGTSAGAAGAVVPGEPTTLGLAGDMQAAATAIALLQWKLAPPLLLRQEQTADLSTADKHVEDAGQELNEEQQQEPTSSPSQRPHMRLVCRGLGDVGLMAVAAVVRGCVAEQTIHMEGCSVSDDVMLALCEALKSSQGSVRVELSSAQAADWELQPGTVDMLLSTAAAGRTRSMAPAGDLAPATSPGGLQRELTFAADSKFTQQLGKLAARLEGLEGGAPAESSSDDEDSERPWWEQSDSDDDENKDAGSLDLTTSSQAFALALELLQIRRPPAAIAQGSHLPRLELASSRLGGVGHHAISYALRNAPVMLQLRGLHLCGFVDCVGSAAVTDLAGAIRAKALPSLCDIDVSSSSKVLSCAAAEELTAALLNAPRRASDTSVLRLGPVEPSAQLMASLAALSGLRASGSAVPGAAAGRLINPAASGGAAATWKVAVVAGSEDLDKLCCALAGSQAALEDSDNAGRISECPGIPASKMESHHTFALAWAICSQNSVGVLSSAVAPKLPAARTTALLRCASSDAHSPSAASLLHACAICLERCLSSAAVPATGARFGVRAQTAKGSRRPAGEFKPTGVPGAAATTSAKALTAATLADAVIDIEPHALTDTDAAVLALMILPGNLGHEHALDLKGTQLSSAGMKAVLQLLPFHHATLHRLDVSGVRFSVPRLAMALKTLESLQRLVLGDPQAQTAIRDTGLLPGGIKCLRDLALRTAGTELEHKLLAAVKEGDCAAVETLVEDTSLNVNVQDEDGSTPLHLACSAGHADIVEALIRAGAERSPEDKAWSTPLHLACSKGCAEIVETLIQAGADRTAEDKEEITPLHRAAEADSKEAIEALLAADVACNPRDSTGRTPLYLASQLNKAKAVKALVAAGANVNRPAFGTVYRTALHEAAAAGHVDVARELLAGKASSSERDRAHRTPLHVCCAAGHAELAQILLDDGKADPEAQDSDGRTAFLTACKDGHKDVAAVLLERAPGVLSTPDEGGMTPLSWACANGHEEVATFLLEHNADPTTTASRNYSALHSACDSAADEDECCAVANALLQHAKNDNKHPGLLEQLCEGGLTALHLCARRGRPRLVEVLVKHGAKAGAQDERDDTPLHLACTAGHEAVVAALVRHQPSLVHEQSKNGWQPLHVASASGHEKVVQQLLDEHVDVDAVNSNGDTALTLACEANHIPVVKALLDKSAGLRGKGRTSLHAAAQAAALDIISILLPRLDKHDLDAKWTKDGSTALMLAAKQGAADVIAALVAYECDIALKDYDGATALHHAARAAAKEAVERLLRAGADPNCTTYASFTPLHAACESASSGQRVTDVVELLLGADADVNARTKDGKTPLAIAAAAGKTELVALLEDSGAK